MEAEYKMPTKVRSLGTGTVFLFKLNRKLYRYPVNVI